ncbi:MAG: cytochrome B, partial [Candidatus Zixiibacteriota bacterium]
MKKRLLTFLIPTLFLILPVVPKAFAQSVEDCMMCHADESLTKEDSIGKEISLFVDQSAFEQSIHGMFDCTACHLGVEAEYHEEPL